MFQEQPSIALLIDCWSANYDRNVKPYPNGERSAVKVSMFRNIINFLNSLKKLQAVCLVTYQSSEYQTLHQTNLYYRNTWAEFLSYRQTPDQKNKFTQDIEEDQYDSSTVTDPVILEHVWNCPQYFITRTWHLHHLISKKFSNTQDIYVFGESWNNCVRERPLGVLNLLASRQFESLSPDTRILSARNCILKYGEKNIETFMNPDEYNLTLLSDTVFDLSNTQKKL